MTLTRTLCGLAALAGTAATASAQLAVMPAPTGPNRIVYPAPPWITNGMRPGAVPPAGAPMPVSRAPEVVEGQPKWTGPTIHTVSAPVVAPDPAPARAAAPQVVAASEAPAARPGPGGIVVPTSPPVVTATYQPPPTVERTTVQPRPAASPAPAPAVTPRPPAAPAAAPARPDVWKPAAPATLPGTTVPAPRAR